MCKVAQRKVVYINKTLAAASSFTSDIYVPFEVDEIKIDSFYIGNNANAVYVLKTDLISDDIFLIGDANITEHPTDERFTVNKTINGTYNFIIYTPAEAPTSLAITGDVALKLEFLKY